MPAPSKKPIRFVFFATAWGSTHGGINSFNRDFLPALVKYLGETVACVVPGASDEEKKDAKQNGVTLLPLGHLSHEQFDLGAASLVLKLADFSNVEYWIGHDIITGEFATSVKHLSGHGKLAVIMHQSYEDYSAVKHIISDLSGKGRHQQDLFTAADKVFAIGPLLHARLLDWSLGAKLIIPGLRTLHHRPAENALRVIVVGRLSRDNALIKGIELAGHAVAAAVKVAFAARADSIAKHTHIRFIGAEPKDPYALDIKSAIEKRAGRPLNVSVIPFLPVPQLVKEIEGANLSLMLSWHEGFGLAGWEAIGAGIPLILSKNSGLFRLLENNGGPALGCVKAIDVLGSSKSTEPFQEHDVEAASNAVLEITGNIKRAINDAAYLRNFMLELGYTWESAAQNFITALEEPSRLVTAVRSMAAPKRNVQKIKATAKLQSGSRQRGIRNGNSRKRQSQNVEYSVADMVAAGGMTAFYPSREYYSVYRTSSSIDAYVSTAKKSIIMISINLMTGVPFDGLCDALNHKLRSVNDFSVTISLLDPRKSWLMQSMSPVLDKEPTALADSIVESLSKLWKLKQELGGPVRERFSIRVHHAIPFGSAILLDHAATEGRIQIETKVYKVALRKSFAFEIGSSGSSGLYNTLVSGYLNLVNEGTEVDANMLGVTSSTH
jgi:glycosyltransferase involved in cell wall biosynthesis